MRWIASTQQIRRRLCQIEWSPTQSGDIENQPVQPNQNRTKSRKKVFSIDPFHSLEVFIVGLDC